MKRTILNLAWIIFAAGCAHQSSQTWEDMKTAGRYMQKGVDAMWGKDYESRMITSDEEFLGPYDDEFIPLSDADLKNPYLASDRALPQPKGIPGEKGIPSLDRFRAPSADLASYFQTVHFETDEHVLRDKTDVATMMQIANYLKSHPTVYVMVEGHADERASASYNMALGMRRANYIRGLLVKHGVDLNRIYTVSRGKEEPIATDHNSEAWKLNRRAEFKIYEK